MTLATEVQARYPTQVLKELTNPRGTATTSIDATKLAQACESIQAYFRRHAQQAYDSTDAAHVETAVRGVVALLQSWGCTARGIAKIRWDDWLEEVHVIRDTGPRARIPVTSSGGLSRTAEATGEKSPFDSSAFQDIEPRIRAAEDDLD